MGKEKKERRAFRATARLAARDHGAAFFERPLAKTCSEKPAALSATNHGWNGGLGFSAGGAAFSDGFARRGGPSLPVLAAGGSRLEDSGQPRGEFGPFPISDFRTPSQYSLKLDLRDY